jgi:hypothetical protein
MMTDDKESQREKLNIIWDSIDSDSVEYLDSNFENIATRLLEFLLISLLNEGRIEIGTFRHGKKQGSTVSYDIYNSDKQLELHLLPRNVFELEVLLFDIDGNEKAYIYKLNSSEIRIIPEGLRNLMKEVLNDMEPRTFEENCVSE